MKIKTCAHKGSAVGTRAVQASAALLTILAGVSAARADFTIQDGTFTPADWVTESLVSGPSGAGAGSVGAIQVSNGNPDLARQVTLTLGAQAGDTILSMHRYGTTNASRYEPAVSGAILALDWTIDYRGVSGAFMPGPGQDLWLSLKQGQVIYKADYHYTGTPNAWTTVGATGLTAASFSRLDGAAGTPNFSAAGAPIRFGFVTGNSSDGSSFSTVATYDNFGLTVHTVPTSGTLALVGAGLIACTRRKRA